MLFQQTAPTDQLLPQPAEISRKQLGFSGDLLERATRQAFFLCLAQQILAVYSYHQQVFVA